MTTYINTENGEKAANFQQQCHEEWFPGSEYIRFDFGNSQLAWMDNSQRTIEWLKSIGREDLVRPLGVEKKG